MRKETQEKMNLIVDLIKQNISYSEIAIKLHICLKTVQKYATKAGIRKRQVSLPKQTHNCPNCDKETTNPKFCCRSCSASYTNRLKPPRKRRAKCLKCDNITKSWRHRYCEEHWVEIQNKKYSTYEDQPLSEYWNRDILKNLHASSKNAHIRGHARTKFKDLIIQPCANCGYEKHVELCHIKSLSSFTENNTLGEVNHKDNIIQLCPNCHWEFDHNHLTLEQIKKSPQ